MLDLIAMTASPVASLLLLGVIGFYVLQRRIVPEVALGAISPLALELALPALIFTKIITRFDPVKSASWYQMPLWWVGFTVGSLALALALPALLRTRSPREFRMSLFIQNGIFLPLIYLSDVYGADSPRLLDLFFFTMFYPAFSFNVYGLFFSRPGGRDLGKLLHPVLFATALAVGGAYLGLSELLPAFVLSSLTMLGATSVPLVMIAVGGSIYLDFRQSGVVRWGELVRFVLAKNVLYPAAALGLVALTHPPAAVGLMIVLQSAVPPLTALPIFAERAGGDRALVAQYLLASFLATIVTLPATMLAYQLWVAPGGLGPSGG
ncbi:MAG: AEC family transporter [Deltaproteobacteria bacterium]|nr:AEC family transporter [Deltaproteobacteria bacterium]